MSFESDINTADMVSVVIPVYNEGGNIHACLRELHRVLKDQPHELLICYDFDKDSTLPALDTMPDRPKTVKLVKNELGVGPTYAMRAGFDAASGDVIITFMADLSDSPDIIPAMVRKVRHAGYHVVSGSRYMRGGSQRNGPFIKSALSRLAGLSLCWIAGVTTHDATTNSRAYSRQFLDQVRIESESGFIMALELTIKAHLRGYKIGEVPSTWKDRTSGESRFFLMKNFFGYLRWYFRAMGTPLVVWGILFGVLMTRIFSGAQESAFELVGRTVAVGSLLMLVRRLRGLVSIWDALICLVWFLPGGWGIFIALVFTGVYVWRFVLHRYR